MTKEQEPVENQEKRVWGLRDEIIAKLKHRGGDPNTRLQEMGYEAIRVASDEDRRGWSALLLHVNGQWSIKFDMAGYGIENPTIDQLLSEYASIQDDGFKALGLRQLRESQQKPRRSGDELVQYYYRQGEEKRKYVEENKPRLLQSLISSLETTLQNL